MAHVPTPGTPPATPLFWVAWYLYATYQWFDGLGNTIKNVWLIGQYLSAPFRSIGYQFKKCSEYVNSADAWLANVSMWLDGIVNGNVFKQLLAWASGHFSLIMQSGYNWVKLMVAGWGYWYQLFIASPSEFVRLLVRAISVDVQQFIDSPANWFYSRVYGLATWYYYFLTNPLAWLSGYVRQMVWWLPTFLDNPNEFLRAAFRTLFPELAQLIDNPQTYFISKLRNYFPLLYLFWTSPHAIFKSLFETVWNVPTEFWLNPFHYISKTVLKEVRTGLIEFADDLSELLIELVLNFV